MAFHFDPVIYYKGWEQDYQKVVELIFSIIPAESIAWLSLGALRYLPKLREIVAKKFPGSLICQGEFTTGEDGKLRYAKAVRVEIFKKMLAFIQQRSADVFVYLCMESPDVWQASGLKAQNNQRYGRYFDFFSR